MRERAEDYGELDDIDFDLGQVSDIPKILEVFDKLKLGRKIEIVFNNEAGTAVREQAGYILPTQLDNSEHLTILKTGEMVITQPRDSDPETVKSYKQFYSPSSLRFQWLFSTVENDIGYADFVRTMCQPMENGKSKVVMTNMEQGASEAFAQKIDDARVTAYTLKEQRINGMATSRRLLLQEGLTRPNFTPFPATESEQTVRASSPALPAGEISLFDRSEICEEYLPKRDLT